ncbi:o-succinylbenzoate--CoA ligase [Sphingobium chlorophenolicum L-1]|uniref:O-succinylbenzoate--CoA ligase n=1 Tax=Sphingobium chlorophenolicum L-1 TaxID=690566 RepID=F6F3T1_SPHCR|nr:AMP-binding protein [Sphingobium chlorophenolicum]AEG51093.1 o-succinylbenzoate--CoA ligase [Sphingobium chlorophenolicum L-1]
MAAVMDDVRTGFDSLAGAVEGAAQARPECVAIVEKDRKATWSQLRDRVAAMAADLHGRGFLPGDRVALLAGVGASNVEVAAALSWAGLVAIPLNFRLSLPELTQAVRTAAATAVLYEPAYRDQAESIAQMQEDILAIDMSDLSTNGEAAARHVWQPGELALILFTGGTTGAPKGVMHSADALMVQGRNVQNCLSYDADTVALHSQPAFHIAGVNQLTALTLAAARIVFRADAGPPAVYQEIAANGVNSIGAVPTTLAMLLASPDRDDALLARLQSVVYGAAPISEKLLRDVRAAMPQARLCQLYGLTESGPISALLPEHHMLDDPDILRSAGKPRSHVEVRIAGPDGAPAGPDVVGEVMLRGHGVTSGYWQDAERTGELFTDGWMHTGDAGFIDGRGFLTIVDRYKDMIVTGGENVYSGEVENIIAAFPGVAACAVYGVPDDFWGEIVTAAVVAKPGAQIDPDAVIAHCRAHIAGYKCPKAITVRDTPLPLSTLGKVLKHVLRAEAIAARQAA